MAMQETHARRALVCSGFSHALKRTGRARKKTPSKKDREKEREWVNEMENNTTRKKTKRKSWGIKFGNTKSGWNFVQHHNQLLWNRVESSRVELHLSHVYTKRQAFVHNERTFQSHSSNRKTDDKNGIDEAKNKRKKDEKHSVFLKW